MSRKTKDRELVALLDDREKAVAKAERAWSRFARSYNALVKARMKAKRLARRIAEYEQEVTQQKETPT